MKPLFLVLSFTALASAQTVIPDGTKLRVRLDQSISSATADQGQTVELSVTEPIKVGDQTVIAEGARVTGTVTEAKEKGRMGRAGKLDFSIDRVRSIDGEWIPLRYTLNKRSGDSHAVRTGVITAGVAVVFWPAAPVVLLMKGKDTTINKGVTFDAFTDQNHTLSNNGPVTSRGNGAMPGAQPMQQNQNLGNAAPMGTSAITINCNVASADVEVDGAYVGSTPTTLQLQPGTHQVTVKGNGAMWQRNLQVTAGSNVTVNAVVEDKHLTAADRRR